MDTKDNAAIDRWIERHSKVPITLDDLPKDTSPVTAETPITYACLLSSISSWPLPSSLTKRWEAEELNGMHQRHITCSVSMSFYHTLSKRFFGSTWVGHEHHFSVKSSTKKLPVDNLNELVYFNSSIRDSKDCFAVVELVVTTLNALDDSVARRYGCGYALIHSFLPVIDQCQNKTTHLFAGSPRDLLQLKGNGALLDQLAKKATASTLSYALWRPEGLLGLTSCLKENCIVGAHVPILGLRLTTISYFDARGSVDGCCIGASTQGNALEWTLLPPQDTDIMASPSILKLSNAGLTIPLRVEFERALMSWVATTPWSAGATTACPKSNRSPLFGQLKFFVPKMAKSEEKGTNSPATAIVHRRLKLGVHNGHTLLHNQWYSVDLHNDSSSTFDQLQAVKGVGIDRYYHSCALLCVVEYTLSTVHTTRGVCSPKKESSHMVTIAVGVAVLVPSLGLKMNDVTLHLMTDPRCQSLCPHPIYTPARDDTAESQSLSFRLRTIDHGKSEVDQEKHESISMDSLTKTSFISDGSSLGYEAKDDLDSSEVNGDTSTLALENTSDRVASPVVKASTANIEDTHPVDYLSSKTTSLSVSVEVGDDRKHTTVTIVLQSFDRCPSSHCESTTLPESLHFRLKLYSYDEMTTDAFVLREHDGIVAFKDPSCFSFGYNYASVRDGDKAALGTTAEDLARFLMERHLFVDVFDEAQLHLGTLTLPLHLFLRQGCSRKTLENLTVPLRATGPVEGNVVLSIHCVGEKYGKLQCPGVSCPAPEDVDSDSSLDESYDAKVIVASRKEEECCAQSQYKNFTHDIEAPHKTLRQQQLQAVKDFRREQHKKGDSTEMEDIDSFFFEISGHDQFEEACQWAREGKKKQLIADHIKKQSSG